MLPYLKSFKDYLAASLSADVIVRPTGVFVLALTFCYCVSIGQALLALTGVD